MKNIFFSLAALLALTAVSFAQSQRMVLMEEFTNATSGPCGTANPAFNTLLDANPTKVVAIKYHMDIPGSDPFNMQAPTIANTRKGFYSLAINPPIVRMDGIAPGTGATASAPGSVTQAKIDVQYGVAASYDIALLHTFSDDKDSVFIYANITCSKAVSGNIVAFVALTEDQVSFPTPPGGNSEKDFYDIAREMYPSPAGTPLPGLGTVGASIPLAFSGPIPAFIYDKAQLRVVAWVQSTGTTKTVHQAAYSPVAAVNDAGMNGITLSSTLCGASTVTVPFTIKNTGGVPLRSLQVYYSIDNGAPQGIPSGLSVTSLLFSGVTKALSTPAIPIGPGAHTIKIFTSKPNSQNDGITGNDTLVRTFVNTAVAKAVPFSHNFSAMTVIDPSLFVVSNAVATNPTWQYSPIGNYNPGSLIFPFFDLATGGKSEIFLPPYDLASVGPPLYMTFDVAHAPYIYPNGAVSDDTLALMASSDCGITWTTLWEKTGQNGLGTIAPIASEFIPANATQWKNLAVDLAAQTGSVNVALKFVGRSNYGNTVFIDNIRVSSSATRVETPSTRAELRVTPNPFSGMALLQFSLVTPATARFTVYNVLGESVITQDMGALAAGSHEHILDAAALPSGIYSVVLEADGVAATQKVVVTGW